MSGKVLQTECRSWYNCMWTFPWVEGGGWMGESYLKSSSDWRTFSGVMRTCLIQVFRKMDAPCWEWEDWRETWWASRMWQAASSCHQSLWLGGKRQSCDTGWRRATTPNAIKSWCFSAWNGGSLWRVLTSAVLSSWVSAIYSTFGCTYCWQITCCAGQKICPCRRD